MKHLIVFMHPTKKSFNGAILDTYVDGLRSNGDTVIIRSLYEQELQPLLSQQEYKNTLANTYKLDVKKEQSYIEEADVISFIFPLWWGGFPAVGKGYIDRIFSYGFAYRLKGESPIPLLTGREVRMIFTSGTPEEEMRNSKMYTHFVDLTEKSIFSFCGLKLTDVLYFGDVLQCGDERRKEMLHKVEQLANKAE
ncbi:NAD(P)H-dependent oxidoreductase [Evansella sp. AB-P1]|uniref:NAD(P)H-dependent oxidoreductase n=1 Tax=Evansella sp. AB-P1 TaxID=3037653 RepID=UPI00241D6788|nr:NAD(P)H-dependent oxidoreductase [Evansella sp. AB-P1]MDG5789206.1 NAD(P)H-dependent oxidoreductase [Evansella sp. AB-P1]